MATNFEFYKDEILKIVNTGASFGMLNGKLKSCMNISCNQCAFGKSPGCTCVTLQTKWLYAEHIEQPKLTKRERAFCEAVQIGWIMNLSGIIYWTNMQPRKYEERLTFDPDSHVARLKDIGLDYKEVSDNKAYKVEDLLKLEVIEEVQEDA